MQAWKVSLLRSLIPRVPQMHRLEAYRKMAAWMKDLREGMMASRQGRAESLLRVAHGVEATVMEANELEEQVEGVE